MDVADAVCEFGKHVPLHVIYPLLHTGHDVFVVPVDVAPFVHCEHDADPDDGEYVPGPHAVHGVPSALAYPARHNVHTDDDV